MPAGLGGLPTARQVWISLWRFGSAEDVFNFSQTWCGDACMVKTNLGFLLILEGSCCTYTTWDPSVCVLSQLVFTVRGLGVTSARLHVDIAAAKIAPSTDVASRGRKVGFVVFIRRYVRVS